MLLLVLRPTPALEKNGLQQKRRLVLSPAGRLLPERQLPNAFPQSRSSERQRNCEDCPFLYKKDRRRALRSRVRAGQKPSGILDIQPFFEWFHRYREWAKSLTFLALSRSIDFPRLSQLLLKYGTGAFRLARVDNYSLRFSDQSVIVATINANSEILLTCCQRQSSCRCKAHASKAEGICDL